MDATLVELSRRAHVYHFGGGIWHWKCGADRNTHTDCLGGRARSAEDAHRQAYDHITEEHCTTYDLPVAPDGCRYCGVEVAQHGVRSDPTMGLHEYRSPTVKQRAARLDQRREVAH